MATLSILTTSHELSDLTAVDVKAYHVYLRLCRQGGHSSERGSCTDCELTVSSLCQHRKKALFAAAAGLDYFF